MCGLMDGWVDVGDVCLIGLCRWMSEWLSGLLDGCVAGFILYFHILKALCNCNKLPLLIMYIYNFPTAGSQFVQYQICIYFGK